jgi:Spy/CpxP family protein refolding chaperone
MRKVLFSLLLAVSFVSFAALNADAQMPGCMEKSGGGMHGGMMMGGMGQQGMGMGMGMMHGMGGDDMIGDNHPLWKRVMELNLDDKQKDALKALHTKTIKEMVKKRADKIIAHVELQDLLEKEPVDMKAVEAAAKKKEAIDLDMFLAHVRAHEEVKALLTPEQRKKFKEMLEETPCGCGMMHHEMHHGTGRSDD